MDHIEVLTRYIGNFVDELVCSGLKHAVISPGSRSTPLAMTLTEHEGIKDWVIIDERSAAFFALGLAKQTKTPVVLVCTSGTAAANYFPAIVEANLSNVPLIVLTADRPNELRDVDAPQAIDQIKMYGDYVRWFHEMALPEASDSMLNYVRNKAARAVHMAKEVGPVHLNFPLREPLVPNFTLDQVFGAESEQVSYYPSYQGKMKLADGEWGKLRQLFADGKRGVIVCGPQTDLALACPMTRFAASLGLPILADPLAQLRSGTHDLTQIIEGYDAILKSEAIRERLKPDFIIRFGKMPVSKSYLFYLKQHGDVPQFIVTDQVTYREPTGNRTSFIFSNAVTFCEDAIDELFGSGQATGWLETWQEMNDIAKTHLLKEADGFISEGDVARYVIDAMLENGFLYTGNSMAVRDLDTFYMKDSKALTVLANRGANGIDGMVSSGIGAAATGASVTLLLGDLSFYHDLNGLLAVMQYQIKITIVVVNNNGGGIFSFLPQANDNKHFERLFGTPLDIDFSHIVQMYKGKYHLAENKEAFLNALSQTNEENGLSVIEVKTDRELNATWHRERWQDVEEALIRLK